MDLRGPVRRAAVVRRRHALVARDELPPDRVEVAVGIGVQRPLERVHHEHPAREDEELRGPGRSSLPPAPRRRRAQTEDELEPLTPSGERAAEERRRLGRDEVRRTEEPGKVVAEPEVVDAVAELVEHRVRRVVRRDDVREDPHVAAAVDVDAEGVLVLARLAGRGRCARGSRRPRARARRTCGARARRCPARRSSGSRSTAPSGGVSWKNGSA